MLLPLAMKDFDINFEATFRVLHLENIKHGWNTVAPSVQMKSDKHIQPYVEITPEETPPPLKKREDHHI